jgi:hypothetical protein
VAIARLHQYFRVDLREQARQDVWAGCLSTFNRRHFPANVGDEAVPEREALADIACKTALQIGFVHAVEKTCSDLTSRHS